MFSFIKKYIKNEWCFLAVLGGLSFFSAVISLILPYLNGQYINIIIDNPNNKMVISFLFFIGGISCIYILVSYICGIINAKAIALLSYEVYKDLIKHIQKLPYLIYVKMNPSYLNQRITTDTNRIWSFFLTYYVKFFLQAITFLVSLYIIFSMNFKIALIVISLIPVYICAYIFLKKKIYNLSEANKEESAKYYKTRNELLEMGLEIKINALYDASEKNLRGAFDNFLRKFIKYNKTVYWFNSIDSLISTIIQMGVLIIGGFEVIDGNMLLGDYVIINTYCNTLFQNIKFMFTVGQEYQDTLNSYNRISELFSMEEENITGIGERIERINEISLKNISFKYDEDIIFSDFSLSLKKGDIYILTGANGSGKTTLSYILMGLLSINGVWYNNCPLSDIDIVHLRKEKISVLLQNPHFLDTTVKNNIKFFTGYENDKLKDRIHQLEAKGVFADNGFNVDKNYEKNIKQLSGGEKQRMQMLELMLLDKELVILDEPTSQMDNKGIDILISYVKNNRKNKIVVIITHDSKLINTLCKEEFVQIIHI